MSQSPASEKYLSDNLWIPSFEENLNGDKFWRFGCFCHRENDLPAVVYANGDKFWYIHGERHRENDRPAVEYANGDRIWYIHGKRHRENDKPAIEYINDTKMWFLNGVNITLFRSKYMEVRRIRAQKKIYFWIIQRLYRPGSDSAKRLTELSWKHVCEQ